MHDKKAPEAEQDRKRRRVEWLDTAKMLTMILVVVGHSFYTKNTAGFGAIGTDVTVDGRPGWVAWISYAVLAIYTFHMPAFFMLSGVSMAIARPVKSFRDLAARKARRLLVPFVFVTLLYVVPLRVASGMYDHHEYPFLMGLLGNMTLMDASHLWFLPALFAVTLLFYAMVRYVYPRSRILFWTLMAGMEVVYLSSWFIKDDLPGIVLLLISWSRMPLFYAIGYFGWERLERLRLSWPWVLLSWALFSAALVLVYRRLDYSLPTFCELFFTVWGVVNLVLTTHAARRIRYVREGALTRSLTENGYDIYLYSDTVNYLIIAASIVVWGYDWMFGGFYACHVLARVVLQFLWAYLVIYAIGLVVKLWRGFRAPGADGDTPRR